MTNPIDDALQSKEAVWGLGSMIGKAIPDTAGGAILRGGLEAGAGVGLLGLLAGVTRGVSKLHEAAVRKHEYNQMMTVNPDLAERREENPAFFNAAYTSLRSLNPLYGRDPVVAGALMRRMAENPAGAGTLISQTLSPPRPGSGQFGLQMPLGDGIRADYRREHM